MKTKIFINSERVRQPPNPFRVDRELNHIPGLSLALQPWAAIVNAFGVFQAEPVLKFILKIILT